MKSAFLQVFIYPYPLIMRPSNPCSLHQKSSGWSVVITLTKAEAPRTLRVKHSIGTKPPVLYHYLRRVETFSHSALTLASGEQFTGRMWPVARQFAHCLVRRPCAHCRKQPTS